MQKLPVGQTIGAAYRFAFGDIVRLFGIAWFPLLLTLAISAVNALLTLHMAGVTLPSNPNYPFAATSLSRLNAVTLLILIVLFVLRIMLIFGLTQEALTPSPQRRLFYFSLGGRVWTLVLGYFLFLLILIGIFIGLGLIFGIGIVIAGIAASAQDRPSAHSITLLLGGGGLGVLLVFVFVIYLSLRWTLLMAPVAVMEGDIGLGRSWQMMRGNVGRAFVVGLAVFLPFMLVTAITLYLCYGGLIAGPMHELLQTGLRNLSQEQVEATMKMLGVQISQRALTLLPFSLAWAFVASAIFHGLLAGAVANAYRALVAGSPPAATV